MKKKIKNNWTKPTWDKSEKAWAYTNKTNGARYDTKLKYSNRIEYYGGASGERFKSFKRKIKKRK